MSSASRGRGGRNPRDMPRDQQVSRKVSWLLRHGAEKEGLKLAKGGWVNVQEALDTPSLRKLNITFQELKDIVATNDKQRFSLIPATSLPSGSSTPVPSTIPEETDQQSDSPSDYLIRANQGHSLAVDATDLLTPITVEAGNVPSVCVHGTNDAAWKLILQSGGLRKMGRNHVHFAAGLPSSFTKPPASDSPEAAQPPVISGMRNSSTVLIYVDVRKALDAGIKFWKSENGVILTEGNEKGVLEAKFFEKVERRAKGNWEVLMKDGVLPEGTVVDVEAWEKEVGDGKKGRPGRGKGRGGRGGGGKGRDGGRRKDGEKVKAGEGDEERV